MGEVIRKRTIKEGIEINVIIKDRTFDVYVDITPEADLSKKIDCEEFTLKFRSSNQAKKLDRTIRLARKNVKYNNNSDVSNLPLSYQCREYKCKISLAPKVYVTDEIIEEIKIKRMEKRKNKPKKKKVRFNDKYRPGRSVSSVTKYSKNNITRPYSGGLCTPK